jgi:hypothetical protein
MGARPSGPKAAGHAPIIFTRPSTARARAEHVYLEERSEDFYPAERSEDAVAAAPVLLKEVAALRRGLPERAAGVAPQKIQSIPVF